ncbi:S8 family serine peptidase [Flavobacteriaceae bacterium 3-367]
MEISQNEAVYEANVLSSKVLELVKLPFVIYVDRSTMPKQVETPLLGHDLSLNKVSLLHSNYPNYLGDGIVISIKEGLLDVDDVDFKGRVLYDYFPSNPIFSRHATEMATIAAGAGNTSPDFRGVAWGTMLLPSISDELTPDDEEFLKRNRVSVQNHSYGVGVENYYGIEAYLYDLQTYKDKNLIHVFSSGNKGKMTSVIGNYQKIQGFSNITGQFKTSKNTICVGASNALGEIWEFSSKGPTNDGRIKPEVVAYGANGSSESAALVTGLAAVLQQAHLELYGKMPNTSLIKAAVVNSADSDTYELTHRSGFGNVDAVGSLDAILGRSFFEDIISSGTVKEHRIVVPATTKKINITLAWNDPPTNMGSSSMLVNDLDLALEHKEGGKIWHPWVLSTYPHLDSLNLRPTRKRDNLNNVEKISVNRPMAGEYIIHINPFLLMNSEDQEYSVVYEYETEDEWIFPPEHEKLESGADYYLRWDLKDSVQTFGVLQWLDFGDPKKKWVNIANKVDPNLGYFLWQTPEKSATGKLRLIGGKVDIESPVFMVSGFQDFNLEYHCNTRSLISWHSEPGAKGYKVYAVDKKYMEVIGTTADTVFNIAHEENHRLVVAVAPIINGEETKRTRSKNISKDHGCYINDFFLEKPFSDKSEFTLILNSHMGVDSVSLERLNGGSFEPISKLSDIDRHEYSFTDPTPNDGTNTYRAKVVSQDGTEYYSKLLDFLFLGKNMMILSPVPACQGEKIQLYSTSEDCLLIEVFSLSGKLLVRTYQNGLIRQIDTSRLYPGLYIVSISGSDFKITKKIVVI